MSQAGFSVAVYATLVTFVAIYFRRFNRNADDYFRAAGAAPWWLVGVSIFMQSFSAVTFTGVAAQAYVAGVSAGWVIWCNAFIFLIHALVLAPRFRRTRAQTQADVIRERFGVRFEQLFVYLGALTTPLFLAVNLLGAATFVAAMFGFNLLTMIAAIGSLATISSVAGGRWGCMANGFLQMLVLMAVTGAIGWICLQEVGGFAGLFELAAARGLDGYGDLFRPTNDAPAVPGVMAEGALTSPWLAALLLHATIMGTSLATACRYHAVCDEHSSRKSAWLACALLMVGSVAWGVPAFTSRLLYAEEVQSVERLRSPEDSAYVVAAKHVLPPAATGLVVVSMVAATVSVLEGAQAFAAGNLANNALPALLRSVGRRPPRGETRLVVAQAANLLVGITVAGLAMTFAVAESGAGMFDLMLELMGSIGLPMHVPLAMGMVWRRSDSTSAWASLGVGFATSATLLAVSVTGLYEPLWHTKVALIAAASAAAFAVTAVALPGSLPPERKRINAFFAKLDRPLSESEVASNAQFSRQQRAIGAFGILVAVLTGGTSIGMEPDDRVVMYVVSSLAAAVSIGVFFSARPSSQSSNPPSSD